MIRTVALLAACCALLSCSKKYPLVGTFAGSTHVEIIGHTTTKSDEKAMVVVTTEQKSDGAYYVATFDGPPFAKPCKLSDISPLLSDADKDPTPGATFPATPGHTCTVNVEGKAWEPGMSGTATLEGGVLTVHLIGYPNGEQVFLEFKGKRDLTPR